MIITRKIEAAHTLNASQPYICTQEKYTCLLISAFVLSFKKGKCRGRKGGEEWEKWGGRMKRKKQI